MSLNEVENCWLVSYEPHCKYPAFPSDSLAIALPIRLKLDLILSSIFRRIESDLACFFKGKFSFNICYF
jgi:hypothetical protein